MNGVGDSLRAALLTPFGRGAVAVVGLCGIGATEIVAKHFQSASGNAANLPIDRIRFGRWRSEPTDERDVGEELVVCRRGEHDYEIHCHGGTAASSAVLDVLRTGGSEIVSWPAWFAARSEDVITLEAREALARASTVRTASVLVDQLSGALRAAIVEAARHIKNYDPASARTVVDRLLSRAALGVHLVEPFRVVLTGRPNVGKSSLINALVGYQRAVVFDEPGTTRDVVTAATALDGWPVELSDTAGIRDSRDELEAAGIAAARRRLSEADLVVAVFDRSAAWCNDDASLLAAHPQAIVVHNKADLPIVADERRPAGLDVSAATNTGIDALIAEIVSRLVPDAPQPGEAVPFTTRQVEALQDLAASLADARSRNDC